MTKQDVNAPWQKETWFYKKRDGTIFPYYKEDILKEIDVFKPKTFLLILKQMDYPFIEDVWLNILTYCLIDGRKNIFGKYISYMNLNAYKNYTFEDSDYTKGIDTYVPNIKWKKLKKGDKR